MYFCHVSVRWVRGINNGEKSASWGGTSHRPYHLCKIKLQRGCWCHFLSVWTPHKKHAVKSFSPTRVGCNPYKASLWGFGVNMFSWDVGLFWWGKGGCAGKSERFSAVHTRSAPLCFRSRSPLAPGQRSGRFPPAPSERVLGGPLRDRAPDAPPPRSAAPAR